MVKLIKRRKMLPCKECKVTYLDGTEELIQFYEHLWQDAGISLMVLKGGSFKKGELVVGEVRIPWTSIKKIEGLAPV